MKNYVLNSGDFTLVTERRMNSGGNAEALIKLGRILMPDNKIVEGREFVKVVNSALAFFEAKYPFEYRYISGSPVIYLLDDKVCSTMAVDDRGVLYINVGFLYNKAPYGLEMQPGFICNILYHECMHTFLSHVSRCIAFNEKNSEQKLSWQDMNIAADLEVNSTMVVDKICTKNFWEMYKGCYLDDVVGLPMESIAKNHRNLINHFKKQPPIKPFGNQMGKQSNQQGDTKTQNVDKDYSNMSAQEAAKDAEKSADSVQLSADDAKRNFGENSQQAKDAQNAADKARDAANKANDAASKGDTKEAQNQAKEASEQANKAEQAANGMQNDNQQNVQQGQQSNDQQKGQQGDQGGMEQGGDDKIGQGQSDDGNQVSQIGSQDGNSSQGQGGKDYSTMSAQDAAQDAMESANQAQDAANMAKKWSGENSQQAKDAQQAANNAKDAASKAAEAAGRGDNKEAQRQAREAAKQAKRASDAAKNALNRSGNNQKDEEENNIVDGGVGDGMGDNGKSMYDAELHVSNNAKQTVIGEILRQREVNNNLKKSLEESGFDKNVVSEVCEEVESLSPKSTEELSELRNNIIKNKPNSGLAKICTDIKISDEVVENVWEEIVKTFLESNTLYAGKKKKIADRKHIKWGDRRTLGIDMIRPYHPKTDAAPQNINVLVDTSISIDMKVTLLFAQTLANCCDKLEYSGVTLIPFATVVDEKSAVYFTGDEAKKDKEAIINRVVEMATNNSAGGSTRLAPCVDTIVKYSQNEPKSVWIILTDGEFSGEKNLKRLLSSSNRILFVIYNKKFEKKFKTILKWCVEPDYDKLSKCYIDVDEQK